MDCMKTHRDGGSAEVRANRGLDFRAESRVDRGAVVLRAAAGVPPDSPEGKETRADQLYGLYTSRQAKAALFFCSW